MRFFNYMLTGWAALALLAANAEYEVTYTFANGAKRTTDKLVVQNGRVILSKENLQVPVAQVKSAIFFFEQPLALEACATDLKRGAYDELVARIDEFLAPVKQGLMLNGNLDEYVQYKMRACFWAEKYGEALETVQILTSKGSEYAPLARMYDVLIRLEQETPVEEIRTAFSKISNPQETSGAMAEYILGRLHLAERERETALQHFSNVLVYHRRDPEWVPAATFYEGMIYKATGFLEQAANVAEELKIAYPDSYWGVRAEELK